MSMLVPTWLLIGASLFFGVDTALPVGVARQAGSAVAVNTRSFVAGLLDWSGDAPPTPSIVAGSAIVAQGIYAAIWDWIDADNEDYTGIPSVRGAEADAYFGDDPEVQIKNAPLDRLSEVRLVKGVAESRIPWQEWQARFAAFPKPNARSPTGLFWERIDVNVASAEEIAAFLKRHDLLGISLQEATHIPVWNNIEKYIGSADDLAQFLVPADVARPLYDQGTLEQRIQEFGAGLNVQMIKYLFSTVNQWYRIVLTTEVNGVQANLRAVVHVPRNPGTRTGSKVEVLWWSLE